MRQVPVSKFVRYFFPHHLRAIFLLAMCAQIAYYMMYPILAFLFFSPDSGLFAAPVTMVSRSAWYGTAVAIAQIGAVIACLGMGVFSDRYGRKQVLQLSFLGIGLFAAGTLWALQLHMPWMLCAFILLGGSCINVASSTSLAVVGDVSNASQKLSHMALLQFFISIGAMIGPTLGGVVAQSEVLHLGHYQGVFWLALLVCVGVLLGLFFWQETCQSGALKRDGAHIFQGFKEIIQHPVIRRLSMVLILCQLSWATYYEFMPAVMKVLFHFTPEQVGLFVGMIAWWLIVATAIVIPLLKNRLSQRGLLRLSVIGVFTGALLALIASYLVPYPIAKILLWISAVPIAMGDVILYSIVTAQFSQAVSGLHQGKMMGLLYALLAGIWAVTGLIGGYLLGVSPQGVLWFVPLGGGILLFVFPALASL